jgi:adenylate cyclase
MWPKLKKRIWRWRGLLITAPSIAVLVIVVGSLGLFQLLEWATLDKFFRLRPREPIDPRITIITIDESDISYAGQWPISDAVMAQVIENIKKQQPRAIGLDIYRNLPVEPGHQALVNVFKSTPNLIGVEKGVGNTVNPPPILSKLEQVALSDLVLDADGKVRRALLSAQTKDGKIRLTLGTKLSLIYLEKEGINLKMIDDKKQHLGLGKAIFVPLSGNEGGYVRVNTGGYQILLNYRGTLENFQHISLKDVLENRIPTDSLRDRVVLIGATAQSLNDLFFTPYSGNSFKSPKRLSGVMIHANLTSQILSAAKDGRTFLKAWSEEIEWLWILLWSGTGVQVTWMVLQAKQLSNKVSRKWIIFSLIILLTGSILIGSSYLIFLVGWWIPVISPLFSLIGSAIAIAGYHSLELQRDNSDLEILLETTTEHFDQVTAQLEHQTEEVVQESERRLAQFLEAMPVAVAVLDAQGKPYYLNRSAEKLLGQGLVFDATPQQLSEIYQLYIAGTNQLYPCYKLPIVQALKGKYTSIDDMEIHQKDQIIPIEAWGTPIYDKFGKLTYALVGFKDITERKKSEAELIKLTSEVLQLNLAYSRFVPRQFLQFLNKESITDVQLGDQVQQEMSVLFADIRDFTTLSEMMTPQDNFKFINAYLSRMEPAIIENQGFIDKYIGDAIMGLFSSGADHAVQAGIDMLHRLAKYNIQRSEAGRLQIQIGIGINTGSMMLGTVGSKSRMDGTVISDAVNLGSRLEGLTKSYGVSLLISHHTFLALSNPADYCFRLIDRLKVKGKSELVTVYEIFDADPTALREGKLFTKPEFEKALFLYIKGNFPAAANLFENCLYINPDDPVAKIYLQRCQEELRF